MYICKFHDHVVGAWAHCQVVKPDNVYGAKPSAVHTLTIECCVILPAV